ncbi:MAG: TRL domain-containing protein [Nitrospiria bacterium]
MKWIRLTALFVVTACLLTGCLYSHIQTPYDTHLDRSSIGPKQGKASAYSVLWLFSWGDQGIAAAAKNGGLATVIHMDQEILSVLFGLYVKTTTIAYGN